MAKPKKHDKVKLFAGLIGKSRDIFSKTESILEKRFGKIDSTSETIPFDFTDYYSKEMGNALLRKWVSFEKLIEPSKLPDIKIFSNKTENRLAASGKRKVNIDPGYLDTAKIVLASGHLCADMNQGVLSAILPSRQYDQTTL